MIRVSSAGRGKSFFFLKTSRPALERDYFPEIKRLGEYLKNMCEVTEPQTVKGKFLKEAKNHEGL